MRIRDNYNVKIYFIPIVSACYVKFYLIMNILKVNVFHFKLKNCEIYKFFVIFPLTVHRSNVHRH